MVNDMRFLLARLGAGLGVVIGAWTLGKPWRTGINTSPSETALGAFSLLSGLSTLVVLSSPRALFNVSLFYTLNRNKLLGHRAYDRVLPRVILGAIPLQKQLPNLLQQEQVTSVLSVVQRFELEAGFLWQPVSPQEWTRAKVQQLVIDAPDFGPVPIAKLEQGADFLHKQLQKSTDGSIYVHCKAGRGRSTSVLLMYLTKHRGMDFDSAWSLLSTKRPQIHLNRGQKAAIKEAVKTVRGKVDKVL
eukprot:gb/GEZN01013400.1/.p1 GENE.gb/GEZN01013400.1/~~gb/GEZN01013400.1/.p1  ORF type:complete len:245 (+),score=36.90 gb/GEZN01013400.1/:172-906(+)